MRKKFYHGTSQKAYQNILRNGFKVGSEATIYDIPHKYIYLTHTKSHAKKYAIGAANRHNSYPVILEVYVKDYIPGDDNPFVIEDREEVMVKPEWILSYKKIWEDKNYQNRKHKKISYSWKYEKLFYDFDTARNVFEKLSNKWLCPSIRAVVDEKTGKQVAWIVGTRKPIKECLSKAGIKL